MIAWNVEQNVTGNASFSLIGAYLIVVDIIVLSLSIYL
jgi:hypothetical protein